MDRKIERDKDRDKDKDKDEDKDKDKDKDKNRDKNREKGAPVQVRQLCTRTHDQEARSGEHEVMKHVPVNRRKTIEIRKRGMRG